MCAKGFVWIHRNVLVVLNLAQSLVGISARTGVAAVMHAYTTCLLIRVANSGMYAQPH